MVNFITYDRTQGLLLPPDLCDWVGDDDLVHFIIAPEAADQEDAADPQGRMGQAATAKMIDENENPTDC